MLATTDSYDRKPDEVVVVFEVGIPFPMGSWIGTFRGDGEGIVCLGRWKGTSMSWAV